MASSEIKHGCGLTALALVVIGLITAAFVGPARLSRDFSSWQAQSYGSDWLVVQYTYDGHVLRHWELHDKAIGNEEGSDGIYFNDDAGNMIHLSGHYTFIQVIGNMDAVKSSYLRGPERQSEGR